MHPLRPWSRRPLIWLTSLLLLLFFTTAQASSLFERGSSRFGSWLSDRSQSDFLPPEVAFQPEVWLEGRQIFVRWNIHPDYYLYDHALDIRLAEDSDLTLGEIEISPATPYEDEYFGTTAIHLQNLDMQVALSGTASKDSLDLTLHYQGCAKAGLCYPPQTLAHNLSLAGLDLNAPLLSLTDGQTRPTAAPPSTGGLAGVLDSGKMGWILLLFFVAGLGLTFTPCVLPMLPILSAIIVGKGQTTTQPSKLRGLILSSAYVLGMALTYALIGALMGLFGAGLNLQAALQSPWVLYPFAGLFVLLALAMFGAWELRLPAWLDQWLHQLQQPKGGTLAGVALMGALSTLVVSPCMTAPLAGALVFIATTGDATTGALALFAMALGMGLPLILTGTFGAHWLPKAGQWMNQVKAVFGLLLLAVAIWLVERLLPGALALALWGLLALGIGIFLGAFNWQQRSGWHVVRLTLALALLIYGASLLVGALAGNRDPLQPLAGVIGGSDSQQQIEAPIKLTQLSEVQQAIDSTTAPIMVDLYADWCVSCKVMENRIFPRPEIQAALQGIERIKFDLTRIDSDTQAWMSQQQLFGPPTFLFFYQGEELRDWRIQGEVNARQLEQHLNALNQALSVRQG